MAKKENAAESENKGGIVATIKSSTGGALNVQDLLAQMEKADIGQELGSDYWTIEPGEEARVIFVEMTKMNKMGSTDGEMIDAVTLIGPDGRQKICADKVIVSVARGLANKSELPTPVLVVCTGKAKGQNGSYKEFTINKLLVG